jgi:hypothetical protein
VRHTEQATPRGREDAAGLLGLGRDLSTQAENAVRSTGVVQPTSIPLDPAGLEYPSPIEGKNGSRPEDGSYEDDPEAGISGAEAAERNDHPLVEAVVRLAERGLEGRPG